MTYYTHIPLEQPDRTDFVVDPGWSPTTTDQVRSSLREVPKLCLVVDLFVQS